MGIPEHEARHFEEGVRSGRTLVTVTAPGRASEAVAILERFSGDTAASTYAPDTAGSAARSTDTLPAGGVVTGSNEQYVVRKRVIQETQTVEVPVTREEYIVERPDGTPMDKGRAA